MFIFNKRFTNTVAGMHLKKMQLNLLQKIKIRIHFYIALLLFSCLLTRVIYFYLSSDSSLITAIPDDAFYYLQLARHRHEIGFWTFDGSSPATGFHLLYGYLLLFIYTAVPGLDWHYLFLIVGFAASSSIAISAYITSKTAETAFNKAVSLAAFAPFFSEPIFAQATALMESWLVILVASFTVFFICNNKPASTKYYFCLVFFGMMGTFARSDYGLLPGVFFLSYATYSRLDIKLKVIFFKSLLLLSGAIIGVIILSVHNFYLSGELVQASAQIKRYWSLIEGDKISNSLVLLSNIAFPFFNKKPFLYFLLFAIYPIARSFIHFNNKNQQSKIILHASLLTIIGYIFFYKYNSAGLQNWYSANLITPVALGFSGLLFYTTKAHQKTLAIVLWLTFVIFSIPSITTKTWPHQSEMLNAGLYLKKYHGDEKYASWNAGIISYFSNLPIVNIDGLTNDEIVPYIKSNTMYDYIIKKHIKFIADYEIMFTEGYRRRGGYLDKRVDECITPMMTIDESKVGMGDSKLKLFMISPKC